MIFGMLNPEKISQQIYSLHLSDLAKPLYLGKSVVILTALKSLYVLTELTILV